MECEVLEVTPNERLRYSWRGGPMSKGWSGDVEQRMAGLLAEA